MTRVLIRDARQLITLRGSSGPRRGLALNELSVIENGAVLIEDGIIREVGHTRRVENLQSARHAEVIEAHGRIVLPGFVDCHSHLISGSRRFESTPSPDGRLTPTAVSDVRLASPSRLRTDTSSLLRECCEHGTTTIESTSGFGLTDSAELKCLRALEAADGEPITLLRGFFALHMRPPDFPGTSEEYAECIRSSLLPMVKQKRLASAVHVASGVGAFDEEECRRVMRAAATLGLRLRVHFAQSARRSGIAFALEENAASVDHLEFAETADVEALARSNSLAVLTPCTSFALGRERFAPARRLVDSGTAVAIASDFSRVISPCPNMQFVIYLACRILRMTPAEALVSATFNAAHVLGLSARIGSIEPGKQADLIVLECPDYRALGAEFGMNLISMTMKRGALVYNRRRFA